MAFIDNGDDCCLITSCGSSVEESLIISENDQLIHTDNISNPCQELDVKIIYVEADGGYFYCNKDTVKKRLPVIKWLATYTFLSMFKDFIAGVTVALTAIPQGIAYATVAGLTPKYGLYSGFVGCFVYAIFGSTKDITIGPTAIMALLTHKYVLSNSVDYAILLTFLSGCVIFVFGFLRLGFLVEFISMPVTCGFTSAAALIIAVSQFKDLFGLPGKADGFINCWIHLYYNIQDWRFGDTVLGFSTIIALILLKIIKDKSSSFNILAINKLAWLIGVARNAVVVIFGTGLAFYYSTQDHYPFKLTGQIGSGFPPFRLPPFSTTSGNQTIPFITMVSDLGVGTIVVPLIGVLESVSIAKAFAKGKTVDATQEMIALGLSNILGSLFSSMPVTGSFTRTAVNNSSGVVSPFGGIFTGIMILLSLGFLTSTFFYIPKATLSGLIISAMIYMVEYEAVQMLWRTKKSDLLPFLTTFVSCLVLGVEVGILVGIAVNLLFILYSSARPYVSIQWVVIEGQEILLVTPRESLVFPATEYIKEVVVETCMKRNMNVAVVIDGTHVNYIDSTMAKGMKVLVEDLEARKQPLYFWRWGEAAMLTVIGLDPKMSKYFRQQKTLADLIKGT
uniref:SLC26A/SulP transporter domain-containing protein n=1 Tax=Clastoptera arizonana TaxID=38151 RepID=A0A1B6DL52_9HEMI